VGEPTSEDVIADIVKNGRRGSLNAVIKAVGKQGHAAYPEKSANPMPVLLDALQKLRTMKLDDGSPGFQPSNLEITTIDVGNTAHNVIPGAGDRQVQHPLQSPTTPGLPDEAHLQTDQHYRTAV
jgi:succinyl-diaminopimelate desuccinylase